MHAVAGTLAGARVPVLGAPRSLVADGDGAHHAGMTDSATTGAGDRPLLVVDVRPSACGYSALLWALQEAERRDAHLLAVTLFAGDPGEPDDGLAAMEEALEATVRRAVEETGVRGRTRLAVVTAPVQLTEVAELAGADLLVVGSEEVAS
jgi:nucleotide-binding universal stress UspA family protein